MNWVQKIAGLIRLAADEQQVLSGPLVDNIVATVTDMFNRGAPIEKNDYGFNGTDYASPVLRQLMNFGPGSEVPVPMLVHAVQSLWKYDRTQLGGQVAQLRQQLEAEMQALAPQQPAQPEQPQEPGQPQIPEVPTDTKVKVLGWGENFQRDMVRIFVPGADSRVSARAVNKMLRDNAEALGYKEEQREIQLPNGIQSTKWDFPLHKMRSKDRSAFDTWFIQKDFVPHFRDLLASINQKEQDTAAKKQKRGKEYTPFIWDLTELEGFVAGAGENVEQPLPQVQIRQEDSKFGKEYFLQFDFTTREFIQSFKSFVHDTLGWWWPKGQKINGGFEWHLRGTKDDNFAQLAAFFADNGFDATVLKQIADELGAQQPPEDQQGQPEQVENQPQQLIPMAAINATADTPWMVGLSLPVRVPREISSQFYESIKFSFPIWDKNKNGSGNRWLDRDNWIYYVKGSFADFADFGNIAKSYGFDVAQLRGIFGELLQAGVVQKERLNGELDGYENPEQLHQAAAKVLQPGFELYDAQKEGVDFLYGRESALLGDETGAGKCQIGSTRVVVNDQAWTLEDLWNQKAKRISSVTEGEEWADLDQDLFVHSMDSSFGITKGYINNLYRERFSGKLRRVVTSDGKECITTFRHRFLKVENNNETVPYDWSNNISVGDTLLSFKTRPRLLDHDELIDNHTAEFLSWMIAEGYELSKPARVSICQKDENVLNYLDAIFRLHIKPKINGIANPRIVRSANRCPSLVISSKATKAYFEKLGHKWGNKSAAKKIPPCIMSASNAVIRTFVRAFFDAEGHASKKSRRIELVSASRLLIYQMSQLLARLGILCSFSSEQYKCATNGSGIKRPYYRLYIVGQGIKKFIEEVGFGVTYKQNSIIEQKANPNSNKDGKPLSFALEPFFNKYNLPHRLVNIPSRKYIFGERQATNPIIAQIIKGFEQLAVGKVKEQYDRLNRSKWTKNTTSILERIESSDVYKVISFLRDILRTDFHFEKVVTVEEIDFDGYVYDLSVKDHHNYISENLISHNTIQGIVAGELRMRQSGGRALVVTKPAVKVQWMREITKFTGEKNVSDNPADGSRWTVVSYAMFSAPKNGPILTEAIKQGGYSVFILDEIHNVKNKSKRTERIQGAGADIPFKWGLSATVSANYPIDVWRQMKAIGHRLGDLSESAFRQNFAGQEFVRNRWGGTWQAPSEDAEFAAAAKLNQWMTDHSGIYIRRSKRDINPDVANHIISENPVELSKTQRMKFNSAVANRLKQYSDPDLAISEMIANRAEIATAKVPYSLDLADNVVAQGKKVLIFTCFRETAAKLEEGANKIVANYGGGNVVAVLGGDKERDAKLDAFKTDPNTKIMILSILAGGTGIDLPNIVDDVIMNDYSWTPMEAEQAEGRAFRVTSENDVTTRYVLAADTVDEDFFALVQKKRRLSAIIDHGTSSADKIKAAKELKKANQEMFEIARRRQQERKQASSWLTRVI